jgi:acetylornithine deacetylase
MDSEQWLRTLVGFDTTSRESNLPLIEHVADYLDGCGVPVQLVQSEDGDKANLWATIGPPAPDGIILSGHTDCVPVDGQPWSSDPFTLVEREGRWYGRGTADMKAFLAAVLAAVPDLVAGRLRAPLHLAFSYDEELGGAGARRLVDHLRAAGLEARFCVVGEPTSMQVVTAHKGIYVYRVAVRGTEAHSSLAPQAVNAAEYASRLLVGLQDLAREKAASGPYDDAFDVTHTTVHAGVIHAGTALNIVPAAARMEFEFRHLPQDDPVVVQERIRQMVDRLGAEMAESDAATGIEVTLVAHLPALDTPPTAEVVAATGSYTDVPGTGKVAYGTEAGLFHDLGVPTVVCGPGSIVQAHRPDEFIDPAQVRACERFLAAVAGAVSADESP